MQITTEEYEKLTGQVCHYRSLIASLEYIATLLRSVEDPKICNNSIKGMYFCKLKKGHRGKHTSADGLLWDEL